MTQRERLISESEPQIESVCFDITENRNYNSFVLKEEKIPLDVILEMLEDIFPN